MILTAKQAAFDTAVKARGEFLCRGIANLEKIRARDVTLAPIIDQMVMMRESLNAALAFEGRHVLGDAPHAPLYLDYIDSDVSNAYSFKDANHSFIGITVRRFFDAVEIASQMATDDRVVSSMGLSAATDRKQLAAFLLWNLIWFVASHEYAHHTHGHHLQKRERRSVGRLLHQALELEADGWASYLLLNHWILREGRAPLAALIALDQVSTDALDAVACAGVLAGHSAFMFFSEPGRIDKDVVYWQTHPLQPVRLNMVSGHALKFASEFRPTLHATYTQPWYQALMEAVSGAVWNERNHAALWREHAEFLATPEGISYSDALLTELDEFRATLREWEAQAQSVSQSK